MELLTRQALAADLRRLGLREGDLVMVHAALRRLGPVLGGADAVLDALLDVVGPGGTLMGYQDWELWADVWDADGRVRAELRDHVPPFDVHRSRPARDHGVLAAALATYPGVLRSTNPGACMAAVGAQAAALVADHPLDHGYGVDTPLARLVEAGGRVLMLGAPWDTVTLLHHAEALADLPDKRLVHREYPLADEGGVRWVDVVEYDTAVPVVAGLADDYFADVLSDHLGAGAGIRGRVGEADCVLVEAEEIVAFAIEWLEERVG